MSRMDSRTEIALTDEERSDLWLYILMTTKYRAREVEVWEKLSTEKNPDGSPRFPHAADNAQFWREMSVKLKRIAAKLDGQTVGR